MGQCISQTINGVKSCIEADSPCQQLSFDAPTEEAPLTTEETINIESSLNFEYQINDGGLNHCDQGLNEGECGDLASSLGLSFTTSIYKNDPKGCFIREGDLYTDEVEYDAVVFNTHATGDTDQYSYLVCKHAVAPTGCSEETLEAAQMWEDLVEFLLGKLRRRRSLKNVNDVFEV